MNNRIATLLLPALVLAGCVSLPPAGTLHGGVASAEVPARFWGQHVFVPMHVTEADTAWVLLDTGSNMSIVGLSTARAAGLAVTGSATVEGYGQDTLRGGVADLSIRVAGSAPYRLHRPVMDLSGLEPYLGKRLDGILGTDFFTRFIVEIDYAGERVILHDPSRYRPRPGDTRIPLEMVEHRPHVRATIVQSDGRELEGSFVIDTGSLSAISLSAPFVRDHGILDALAHTVGQRSVGTGGLSEDRTGRLRGLQLGPFAIQGPLATLSQTEAGLAASDRSAGHIGGHVLERFTVTFDYRRRAMYLRPGPGFGQPFVADMAGFAVVAEGPDLRQYRVDRVDTGSPAERAGLIEGDVLMEVDGRLAAGLTMPEWQDLRQSEPGAVLRVVVLRDGATLVVPIRLERRI